MIPFQNSKDVINLITRYSLKPTGNKNSNLLLIACHYVLSQFTSQELLFGQIALNVYSIIGNSTDPSSILRFIASFYCILGSYKTIYSLPSMMDTGLNPGGVSSHRLYGESVSQLVSVILVGEGYRMLNQIPCPNKIQLFKYLNKEIYNFRLQSKIIQEIKTIDKQTITEDFQKLKRDFLKNSLEGSMIVCNRELHTVQKDKMKLLLDYWHQSSEIISESEIKKGLRALLSID